MRALVGNNPKRTSFNNQESKRSRIIWYQLINYVTAIQLNSTVDCSNLRWKENEKKCFKSKFQRHSLSLSRFHFTIFSLTYFLHKEIFLQSVWNWNQSKKAMNRKFHSKSNIEDVGTPIDESNFEYLGRFDLVFIFKQIIGKFRPIRHM